jgi:hypothetical protein
LSRSDIDQKVSAARPEDAEPPAARQKNPKQNQNALAVWSAATDKTTFLPGQAGRPNHLNGYN